MPRNPESGEPKPGEMDELMKQIYVQGYEKIKTEMEKSRKEMGIQKTPEELKEEDKELRRRFGLEEEK